MKLFIVKLFIVILCAVGVFLGSSSAVQAANPTVTGRVIMEGTNTPISGVWVKWTDSGSDYKAYRYAKTDNNGRYTFADLSELKSKDVEDMMDTKIDTNGDGAKDANEVGLQDKNDASEHFSALTNPHAFTAVVPAAWSGKFNTVSGVNLNSVASSITISDIIFTPSDVQVTQSPQNIYTISGKVYDDLDKNGVKGATETVVPGVTITLSGDANATTTTSVTGSYAFKNLAPGDYVVTITLPAGYSSTTASSTSTSITADSNVDFGIALSSGGGPTCSAIIRGEAFNDVDGNGKMDGSAPPLSNWTVTLSSAILPAPVTTQTDSTGNYSFTNLCAGSYMVTLQVPSPWEATTASSRTIMAKDGQIYSANNFGARAFYSITGNVFNDINSSQLKDAAESGWANATIFISGQAFSSAKTDANGNYAFPKLPAGSYQISLRMPNGYGSSTPNSLNITLKNNYTLNFGIDLINTIKVGGACNNNAADIVIVVDRSKSMDDNDPASGLTKIDEAKRAAKQFIDVIAKNAPTARIGIVQFSDSNNYPNQPDLSGVIAPLSNDFSSLKSTIDGITTNGRTCFQCGVDLAAQMLNAGTRPNSQKMVVAMTDGLANETITSNGADVDTATAENEAIYTIQDSVNQQNIIYHTIGVGSGADSIDETFLTQVAATNGGRYYNDPTNGNMEQIYIDIANRIVASGVITGMLYNDENLNKQLDPGEKPVPNLSVELTSPVLVAKQTTTSDANGQYAFYGLCDGTYSITEIPATPWVLTTAGTYSGVNVKSGATFPNYNFGNRYGYTITGSVFNDINKNRKQDTGDKSYTGGITIGATGGTLTTDSNTGTYKVEGLWPGTYTISYISPLPPGYILVYPKNGPPPSFLVTVGVPCSVDTTSGASCTNGDVKNLDFAISNSIPWMQTSDMDVRLDSGITNKIPPTSLYPQFALTQSGSAKTPGVLFLGNGTADLGSGKASSADWIVGGGLYPEVFKRSSGTASKVSYTSLLTKAQQAKVTINDLSTIPSCFTLSNCTLPPNLPSGIYLANGDVSLTSYNFLVSRNYVFLINGNLHINGNLQIPKSASALFAVKHDITIDTNIGTTPAFPLPAGQVQGNFSTEENFFIQGINDCVTGPDKMLNIEGSIVVNAGNTGGKFSYERDLCGDNPLYPTFTIVPRLDFIFSTPSFMKQQQTFSNEVSP